MLNAGRLTLMYEGGFIRYIRNNKQEVVRMVNHYLRDRNWNTLPMRIGEEHIETTDRSFVVRYTASIRERDIDFSWQCSIIGNADETISFSIEGLADSDFLTNRLGFTVLLPTEGLRGQSCRVTHPGNETEEVFFPDLISPHQPFLDIQAMAWSPAPGLQAVISFEGDVFEIEDQRNWLDASYKVYCTPLALGFPRPVKKGSVIRQAVHVKVFGDLQEPEPNGEIATFTVDELRGLKYPEIGIPLSDVPVTDLQLRYMKALKPDFVSVVLKEITDVAERISRALLFGRPLEVIVFPEDGDPEGWVLALKPFARHVVRVVVLVAGKRAAGAGLVNTFAPLLRRHLPKAKIGSGTDAFFTELNRNRTPAKDLDFLSFSVNPQTHASDLRTMTENLAAHSDVVESCRALSGNRGVRVGPVTLRMRWNPDATSVEQSAPDVLPPSTDVRQLSLFAAGWLLGSVKYLAESGADVVTYFEMAGRQGLMAHPAEPWPAAFGVGGEALYPVYYMMRFLLAHKESVVLPLTSSDPLRLEGMAFRDDRVVTVIVANFTGDNLSVSLPHGFGVTRLMVAGADNIEALLARVDEPVPFVGLEGEMIAIPPFGFAVLRT